MTVCFIYVLVLFNFFISGFNATHYIEKYNNKSANNFKLSKLQNTPVDNSGEKYLHKILYRLAINPMAEVFRKCILRLRKVIG